jgi:putative transposase
MARPLRLDHAGAVWHVTSRGNERREVFRDADDRDQFLSVLSRCVRTFRWRVHAYVLMGNHYHLLLETPEAGLSRGMRQLNGIYTQRFNRRHRRVGHLFQGRFKSILVEKESHLLELARYVVLNPVRAGLTQTAGQWRWSSYRATAGLTQRPNWLEVEWTLARFAPRKGAHQRYRRFVAEGKGSGYAPWEELVSQVYLGGEAFLSHVQKMAGASPRSRENPRPQRIPIRPGLADLIREVKMEFGIEAEDLRRQKRTPARLALAYLARELAVLRLSEFAASLGVQTWAASHLATSAEQLAKSSRRFEDSLARLHRALTESTLSQT